MAATVQTDSRCRRTASAVGRPSMAATAERSGRGSAWGSRRSAGGTPPGLHGPAARRSASSGANAASTPRARGSGHSDGCANATSTLARPGTTVAFGRPPSGSSQRGAAPTRCPLDADPPARRAVPGHRTGAPARRLAGGSRPTVPRRLRDCGRGRMRRAAQRHHLPSRLLERGPDRASGGDGPGRVAVDAEGVHRDGDPGAIDRVDVSTWRGQAPA